MPSDFPAKCQSQQILGYVRTTLPSCKWRRRPSEESHADAVRPGGGSKSTRIYLLPQRGQRSRASSRESGKSRPRVVTNVVMSSAWRNVHSRLDREPGPSARPRTHRAVTAQPADHASPKVSTLIRTNRVQPERSERSPADHRDGAILAKTDVGVRQSRLRGI